MTVIYIVISISIVISVLAVFYAFYERHQLKKSFGAIEKMLDSAIDGDFSVDSYEETRLSRLESKLWEYLSSSSLSAQNVNKEKDKLKELISDISHQTKTPIANLVLYGELLETSELTEEQKARQDSLVTEAYKKFFAVVKKHKKSIHTITFWGLADNYSWLNSRSRQNAPFLFDGDYKAKKAYFAVRDLWRSKD